MKKVVLFLAVFAFASCQKDVFETTVKTLPKNVGFSLNPNLPYYVTVQAETLDKNAQFVFTGNKKAVYNTFKDAMLDTSDVKISVFEGEIIDAKKISK